MAVVINDFEVLVEPAPEAPAASAPTAPSAGPTPQDIEQAVRRQMERAARVRAD